MFAIQLKMSYQEFDLCGEVVILILDMRFNGGCCNNRAKILMPPPSRVSPYEN
jgi:hypothetical protein